MNRAGAVALALLLFHAVPTYAQIPQRETGFPNPAVAFIASAVLPGAGQYYAKADRWPPFIAVEVWAWVKYLQRRDHGEDLERRYRDLAWSVARRISAAERRDSVFTYYEAVGQHAESGLFDAEPRTPTLEPERDVRTFNGEQWEIAKRLFFRGTNPAVGSPEYERALAYYRTHAIPPGYIWSWRNSELEFREYRETISRSDEAHRSATRMLGVILANHLVSAVDALVIARVQALSEHRIRLGSALEPAASGYIWMTTVRIPIGAH